MNLKRILNLAAALAAVAAAAAVCVVAASFAVYALAREFIGPAGGAAVVAAVFALIAVVVAWIATRKAAPKAGAAPPPPASPIDKVVAIAKERPLLALGRRSRGRDGHDPQSGHGHGAGQRLPGRKQHAQAAEVGGTATRQKRCLRRRSSRPANGDCDMLGWALTFLVVALIAGVLGFTSVAGAAMGIAKILFFVFLVLFVVSLVMHLVRGRGVGPGPL